MREDGLVVSAEESGVGGESGCEISLVCFLFVGGKLSGEGDRGGIHSGYLMKR